MARKIILLALAGGLGTLARYGLSGLVHRFMNGSVPWGTITVNVTGCFLFGALWSAMESRLTIGAEARIVVLTGFMGAFTTFSTYMFETGELLRGAQWFIAAGNLLGQNVVGLLFLFLGLAAGKLV